MNSRRRNGWLIFAVAIAVCCLAVSCGPDPAQPEARLPRGYGDIMLGDHFDAAATSATEVSSDDGVQRFQIDRAENQPPVTLELDDSGIISRISWEEYVIDDGRRNAVKRQARERFKHFLREEIEIEGGKAMLFEDETTRYRLDFLRQEIRISISETASDFDTGEDR